MAAGSLDTLGQALAMSQGDEGRLWGMLLLPVHMEGCPAPAQGLASLLPEKTGFRAQQQAPRKPCLQGAGHMEGYGCRGLLSH